MVAFLAAVLLSVPVYVTGCLEHPTCETQPPEPEQKTEKVDSPPPAPPVPSGTSTAATPPPTSAPEVTSPTGVEGWRELVAQFFPADQVDTALRVMACESGGDPTAYNPSTATGLMQVHWLSWGDVYGVTVEDLMDPETNIAIAYDIWSQLGWAGQWSCY